MDHRIITTEQIVAFGRYLREEERGEATVEKYLREVTQFSVWLNNTQSPKPSSPSGRSICSLNTTTPPRLTAN